MQSKWRLVMCKGRRLSGIKNAAITVEIGLSVALGLIVLFLAFGLVSNNIQTLAEKTGLLNLAKKEKTTMNSFDKSAERQSIKIAQTQQEVQVIAEQGQTLSEYLAEALATYNKYYPRTDLTPAEAEDLAKAALELKIGDSKGTKITLEQRKYLKSVGITLPITNGETLKVEVNGKSLSVDVDYTTNKSTGEICLDAIKFVEEKPFS